ncbi:MAG: hypothetical protein GYB64_04325 [Chloroflexi bacterium]|nr:hypothetical protein [Chloroflexota bacterium]
MRQINQTRDWVQRRTRTIRFVILLGAISMVLIGAVSFLISRSTPGSFIADLTLNLISEFFGALVVTWLLQGVLVSASLEMQDELEAIRETDAVLEQRLIETEARLREAEVRAEEAEERAALAEQMLARVRSFFSRSDVQGGFGSAASNLISSLLSSITPSGDDQD